jgi:hypothetical protein
MTRPGGWSIAKTPRWVAGGLVPRGGILVIYASHLLLTPLATCFYDALCLLPKAVGVINIQYIIRVVRLFIKQVRNT